jgi:hypothetical protein
MGLSHPAKLELSPYETPSLFTLQVLAIGNSTVLSFYEFATVRALNEWKNGVFVC